MATETIFIDFQVNTDELKGAQEQLAKAGKVDSSALDALNKRLKDNAGDVKALVAEFKRAATAASQLGKEFEREFSSGVEDALKEAGISMEDFIAELEKAEQKSKPLKTQLKELKQELAQMKLEGRDNTKEFRDMTARAGELADSIADANAEINNMASDSRNIDNVVGSISALASGFAVAQGAAALFGDENEDIQKALLKVNAAMAIATGVQNIYNATLKEGAVTKLADTVATKAQVAVQTLYTAVTGRATAATIAFKVALATTGIGLLVVGVIALVNAFNDQSESLDELNTRLDDYNERIESSISLIDKQTQLEVARAKAVGKAESDILRIQAKSLVAQYQLLKIRTDSLIAERDELSKTSKAWFALNDAIESNFAKMRDIGRQVEILNIQGQAALADEAKTAAENASKAAAARVDANRAARLQELQDNARLIERNLLGVAEGSKEELELKKQLVIAKRNVELAGENLTQQQIELINATAIKERLALEQEYAKRISEVRRQAEIDAVSAQLQDITLSNAQRVELERQRINLVAEQEAAAAVGNAEKIKLIYAERDRQIAENANREVERQLELELEQRARANRRILQQALETVGNSDATVQARQEASEKINQIEINELNAKLAANAAKLQSDEDYKNNRDRILDEIEQSNEAHADRMKEIDDEAAEAREENIKKLASDAIQVATMVADVFASLSSLQTERENQEIEAQKTQLQSLIDAGAISEKEAQKRAQQIEILEKKARQAQAEREKREAIFKAFLAIPQAFLQGLTQGGPVLGAIYAGLAAAQAAIIAARPVPKFFRGKRDKYEGQGIVGDMGAELVERNGRMFLYTKPTQTYLRRNDVVYNAGETRKMLHNAKAPVTVEQGKPQPVIDYDKLAKAIPASNFSVNINKDFIEESVANGLSKNRYWNKWYNF